MYAFLFVSTNVLQIHFTLSCCLILFLHVICDNKNRPLYPCYYLHSRHSKILLISGELKLWPSSFLMLSDSSLWLKLKFNFFAFQVICSLKIQKHVPLFRNKSYLSFLARGISLWPARDRSHEQNSRDVVLSVSALLTAWKIGRPACNVSHIFFWQIGDTSMACIEWLKKQATIKENGRVSIRRKASLALARVSQFRVPLLRDFPKCRALLAGSGSHIQALRSNSLHSNERKLFTA